MAEEDEASAGTQRVGNGSSRNGGGVKRRKELTESERM